MQGSASECVLVSMLAARHAALEELQVQYPNVEDGVLLDRMVAYCSKLVRRSVGLLVGKLGSAVSPHPTVGLMCYGKIFELITKTLKSIDRRRENS